MLLIGKLLFSAIFVSSGINHLRYVENMTGYAKYKKVPAAKLSVILTGIALLVAPVLFVFNVVPQIALGILAAFLLVTNAFMHQYWNETDPQTKQNEQIGFFKNISLAGAALVIASLI